MLIQRIYCQLKIKLYAFIKQQQGVYAMIMAMITLSLLVIIGFTVDGSGLLLDRARLADSLDQAALTITAENNTFRDDNFILGTVTTKNSQTTRTKDTTLIENRDKNLIQGYMQNYINGYSRVSNIDYDCIQEGGRVTCSVDGTAERASLLPIKINKEVFIPAYLDVRQQAAAFKGKEDAPANDIMFVVRGSAEIYAPISSAQERVIHTCFQTDNVNEQGINTTLEQYYRARFTDGSSCYSKYGDLWSVVYSKFLDKYTNAMEFFVKDKTNKHDRVGITRFSLGAQPTKAESSDVSNMCVLPFAFKNTPIEYDPLVELEAWDSDRSAYTYLVQALSSNGENLLPFLRDYLLSGINYKLNTPSSGMDKLIHLMLKLEGWSDDFVGRSRYSDHIAPTMLVIRYLPLYLGIWDDDLQKAFDGDEAAKRRWYDYNKGRLGLPNHEQGVTDTIEQIVDKEYREAYTRSRKAKAKFEEAKKQNPDLKPSENEQQEMDFLKTFEKQKGYKEASGYGVTIKKPADATNWLSYKKVYYDNRYNHRNAGMCFNYSRENETIKQDSAWFYFDQKVAFNELASMRNAGGRVSSLMSGFLMAAYNMANDPNPETEKAAVNTRRVIVIMDVDTPTMGVGAGGFISNQYWGYGKNIRDWSHTDAAKSKVDKSWTRSWSRYYIPEKDQVSFWKNGGFFRKNFALMDKAFLSPGYKQGTKKVDWIDLNNDGYKQPRELFDVYNNKTYSSPLICDAVRARLMTTPLQKYETNVGGQRKALTVHDPKIYYVKLKYAQDISSASNYRTPEEYMWQQCADDSFFIFINKKGQLVGEASKQADDRIQEILKNLVRKDPENNNGNSETEEVGHNLAR